MHLQYRIKLATGSTSGGVGAEELHYVESDPIQARPGALADLAEAVASRRINLRLVAGHAIETGGELILAVDHEREEALVEVLDQGGWQFHRVEPTTAYLPDEIGALAKWARGVASAGRLVDTIAVGTPEKEGKEAGNIPIQATTIAVQAGSSGAQRGQAGAQRRPVGAGAGGVSATADAP